MKTLKSFTPAQIIIAIIATIVVVTFATLAIIHIIHLTEAGLINWKN